MREEEVDRLLLSWDERLHRIDENLIALEGDPTYQMLSGSVRQLMGATRTRVGPALDALVELFQRREALTQVVARARELRGELGFFGKEEKLVEIANLLQGPSIKVAVRELPLTRRNLLDEARSEILLPPEQVLGEMIGAYQMARDAVGAVAEAWARLEPRLADLERRVGELSAEARALGQESACEARVRAMVDDLARIRVLVSSDPLSVTATVDADVAPRIEALGRELHELGAHKASAAAGLARTDALLAKIGETERAAREVASLADREFVAIRPAATAPLEETARGLPEWREKIRAAASAGHWKAADVGLVRWFAAAEAVLAAHEDVLKAVAAARERRTELLGRLSARQAQARALVSRGVEAPPELAELARSADAALRQRPLDLAKAAREVERYEAVLLGVSRL
jgi:hypothetical protein